MNTKDPGSRISVRLKESKVRKLKAKLALKGTSISAWMREKIEQEVS